MSKIANPKECRVLVVEPITTVRTGMADALHEMGFATVRSAATPSDAWSMFEAQSEAIDWIITTVMPEEKINGVHLLALASELPTLSNCLVSFIVSEAEKFCVPDAFALGLLSWHAKVSTKQAMISSLQTALTRLRDFDGSTCLTAASFLRDFLIETKKFGPLIDLEKNLLKLFSTNIGLYIQSAETLFLADKMDEARQAVAQAKLMDPEAVKSAPQLARFLGSADSSSTDDSKIDLSAYGPCLIVDPDEAARHTIAESLLSLGIKDVKEAEHGEAAWELLEGGFKPRMILQEWRLKKLSGPAFLQRISANSKATPLIFVISSLVKEKDLQLLKEVGVHNVVEKPINRAKLIAAITSTVKQELSMSDHVVIERNLRRALKTKDFKTAEALKVRYLSQEGVSDLQKLAIEAEFAFYQERYPEAQKFAVAALKKGADNLSVTNLLGKILLKLRMFDQAVKCFNKAKDVSSNNLERLCDLAEAQAESGDIVAAEASLAAAKSIDKKNVTVMTAESKIDLAKGDFEGAKKIMGDLESLVDIVSYMNNRAVAMARQGEAAASFELYEKAFKSIPDGNDAMKATISYNHGLALLRAGDTAKAAEVLQVAAKLGGKTTINSKVTSLLRRVQTAVERGEKITLNQDIPDLAQGAVVLSGTFDLSSFGMNRRKGEHCCIHLQNWDSPIDNNVKKYLQEFPKFSSRTSDWSNKQKKPA